MTKKRVGLYGGTFNPIHFGHLNLAITLKEKQDLSEIWFIPTHVTPLRAQTPSLSPHHRLKMLELALEEIPGFEICEEELNRPPPSYTVDTVKEILKKYPSFDFFLLFGEDSLLRFREWKDPLEIVKLVPLFIGSRRNIELVKRLPSLGFREEIGAAIRKGMVETPQIEISATQTRERLKKRLYCGHLMPAKVLDYIYENQLYSNNQ